MEMDGQYRSIMAVYDKWAKRISNDPAAERKLWEVWQKLWEMLKRQNVRTAAEASKRIGRPLCDCVDCVGRAIYNNEQREKNRVLAENIFSLAWDDDEDTNEILATVLLDKLEFSERLDDAEVALCHEWLKNLPGWGNGWIRYLNILTDAGDERCRAVADELAGYAEEGRYKTGAVDGCLAKIFGEWGEEERSRVFLDREEKRRQARQASLREIFGKAAVDKPEDADVDKPEDAEWMKKGFSQREDQQGNPRVFLPTVSTGKPSEDVEVPILTDENFVSPMAKQVWSILPEQTHTSLLTNFQCADCMLERALGYTRKQLYDMTVEQREKAMARMIESQRGEDGQVHINPEYYSKMNDIRIDFKKTDAPGPAYGKETIYITGTCDRCGDEINRTYMNDVEMLGMYARMLRLLKPSLIGEPGRNDPCPCGSGKKYKDCCLKKKKEKAGV